MCNPGTARVRVLRHLEKLTIQLLDVLREHCVTCFNTCHISSVQNCFGHRDFFDCVYTSSDYYIISVKVCLRTIDSILPKYGCNVSVFAQIFMSCQSLTSCMHLISILLPEFQSANYFSKALDPTPWIMIDISSNPKDP